MQNSMGVYVCDLYRACVYMYVCICECACVTCYDTGCVCVGGCVCYAHKAVCPGSGS